MRSLKRKKSGPKLSSDFNTAPIFSRPSDIDRKSPDPSYGQHKAKPLPLEITICLDKLSTDNDSEDDSQLLNQFD